MLADVERPRDLGSLPTDDVVRSSLDRSLQRSRNAEPAGDVLFMDQRQLLTFGDIQHVDLVPAYEKKLMMDQALSGNRAYFQRLLRGSGLASFPVDCQQSPANPHQGQRIRIWRGEQCVGEVGGEADPVLLRREGHANEVKVELLTPRAEPSAVFHSPSLTPAMNLPYLLPRTLRHFLPERIARFLLLRSVIIKPGLETVDATTAVAALRRRSSQARGVSLREQLRPCVRLRWPPRCGHRIPRAWRKARGPERQVRAARSTTTIRRWRRSTNSTFSGKARVSRPDPAYFTLFEGDIRDVAASALTASERSGGQHLSLRAPRRCTTASHTLLRA